MTQETPSSPAAFLWRDRWRVAAWVGPALLAAVFAHQALLPLAARLTESRAALATLRENTYEAGWLDSTRAALTAETALLRTFHASRRASLASDSSVQAATDRIRALAQGSGIEVIKTTPVLARSDSLRVLKVKVEGYSRFPDLLAFFRALRSGHPDLFLEEMLIRQGGERSGNRLEASLILHTYSEGRRTPR